MEKILSKSELRKIYYQKRKELTAEQIEDLSKKVFENLFQSFDWDKKSKMCIFFYLLKGKKEIDTFLFIKLLWKQGKNVFVPKVVGKDLECHQIIEDSELTENDWGILEPIGKKINKLRFF